MDNTILIELTEQKAIGILHELEELRLIRVLRKNVPAKGRLSEKYRGIISSEKGQQLNEHIKQMRNEWNSTL